MSHVLLEDLLLFAAALLPHVAGGAVDAAVRPADAPSEVGDAVELAGAADRPSTSLADSPISVRMVWTKEEWEEEEARAKGIEEKAREEGGGKGR